MAGGEQWRVWAKRAGEAVVNRRVALGYRTRAQFADEIKLTPKTLGEIERGTRPSYDRSTYAALDQMLAWPPGSFEAVLTGTADDVPSGGLGKGKGTLIRVPGEAARPLDFALVWLLAGAGLDEAGLRRVEQVVRRRQAELLSEVAALVEGLGGRVSYPWDEVGG